MCPLWGLSGEVAAEGEKCHEAAKKLRKPPEMRREFVAPMG
jgi:hypothetical protein